MNLFPDNAIASELAENGKGLIGKIKTALILLGLSKVVKGIILHCQN